MTRKKQQHGQTERTRFLCLNAVKASVLVCGVGQDFWHVNSSESQKFGRLCQCCVVFCTINCRKFKKLLQKAKQIPLFLF